MHDHDGKDRMDRGDEDRDARARAVPGKRTRSAGLAKRGAADRHVIDRHAVDGATTVKPMALAPGHADDPLSLHLLAGDAGGGAAPPATTSRDVGLAARIVVERAAHVRARPGGASVGVVALLDAATVMVSAIETVRGPLAPGDDDAVAAAIALLAGLAADMPPHESVRLEDLASLATTYAERAGAAASAGRPPRRVDVDDDDGDPVRRLHLARDTLAARVALWGGLYHDSQPMTLLREESAVLATIVREAAAAAQAIPRDGLHGRTDLPRALVLAIGAEVDTLYRIARGARSGQAAVGLDEVFLAEDALFLAADLDAPQHRRRFYADRNAGDLAGAAPRDPALPDGASLVAAITGWFQSDATMRHLAVEGVETVLQEPETAAEPPLLERLLAAAARGLVGLLPGQLFDALEAAAGVHGEPLVETLRAVADPPIDGAIAPVIDAIAPSGRGAVRAGPLATAFLHRCRREIARYVGAVHQQLPALAHALQLVPPGGLQSILDGLAAAGPALHDQVRRELLVRWMTVVHGATSGRDDAGASARGGSIAVASERPGAIRLALVVRDDIAGRPSVQVTRCTARGLGAAVLGELRAAALPIAALAVDRFVDLAVIDAYTGAEIGLGSIYLAPGGALDASGLDAPLELARVARELDAGRATAIPHGDGPLGLAMRRAASTSRGEVERAARLILARAAVTTAQLD